MKIMKKYIAKHLFRLTLMLTFGLTISCSDVEYEAATYCEPVHDLRADYSNSSRKVTLSWQNPAAADLLGIQIIRDNQDVTNIDEVVSSYFIRKAPANQDVAYTVKARYNDGRVSEGQTVRFRIDYSLTRGSKVAMLLPDDYLTASADERDAAEWFRQEYGDQGVVVTPSTIDLLDIEEQGVCWVMCDRSGIGRGWTQLPGGLASAETIDALKAFAGDGGNLLLTNHATQLTVAVGRIVEAYAPGIFGDGDGGYNPDIWGVHPIIGQADLGEVYDHRNHPIYQGMTYEENMYAGIYCFEGPGVKGDHNCMWDLNAYGLVPNPNVVKSWEELTNSSVLGTWNHVVDYCCAGIVDFNPVTTCQARILAVGLAAYEWNTGDVPNSKISELKLFTGNCIDYLKK